MFSIFIDCPPDRTDLLIADLWEAGVAGIVESPNGLRAFFEDDADRAAARGTRNGDDGVGDHERLTLSDRQDRCLLASNCTTWLTRHC